MNRLSVFGLIGCGVIGLLAGRASGNASPGTCAVPAGMTLTCAACAGGSTFCLCATAGGSACTNGGVAMVCQYVDEMNPVSSGGTLSIAGTPTFCYELMNCTAPPGCPKNYPCTWSNPVQNGTVTPQKPGPTAC